MARQPLRFTRGTAAQVAAYTGGPAEPVFNTDTKTLHVQDGVTPGGVPQLSTTGDGSAVKVRPSLNGTVARTQADRARERITVCDFGATGDGSDQTVAVKAAQLAVPTGLLRFPQGTYRTDGTVPTDGASSTAYEMDAPTIVGGYLNGVQDPQAASRATKLFTVPWGNRFHHGLTIQGVSVPTDPTVGYEKTGILIRYEQRDPTSYAPGGNIHDLVGTDWQGSITSRNPTGRIWATSASIQVNPLNDGSDGYVLIHEAGIINNGTAQERMSKTNSKVGVSMIADGTANSTAAFAALHSSPTARWYHGFYVDADAIANNAFVVRNGPDGPDIAGIKSQGLIFGQELRIARGERIQGSGAEHRQTREVVLQGISTGGNLVRLTADGAAPNATNTVNLADYVTASLSIRLIARNATLASQDVAWAMPLAILHRTAGASSVELAVGDSVAMNYNVNNNFNVNVSPDKTNGGLALSFSPPTGSTHQWNVTATVTTTETT